MSLRFRHVLCGVLLTFLLAPSQEVAASATNDLHFLDSLAPFDPIRLGLENGLVKLDLPASQMNLQSTESVDKGRVKERSWRKVPVPAARCGNGEPYHIFLSDGDPDKLALGFMGGGACWNKSTCYGPTPLTILGPMPFMLHKTGIFSNKRGPVKDYTHVYFPYCTGDVYVGRHTAVYKGRETYHQGQFNVEASIKQILKIRPELRFADRLFVHGSSGGAIGALFHLPYLDAQFKDVESKILVADSPGLHFGKKFWNKFSPKMQGDFDRAFENLNIPYDPNDGSISQHMDDLCQAFSSWRIGFMQFDRDIVMSGLFGAIFPFQHRHSVYSPRGIWQTLLGSKSTNCSAWIGEGYAHTVLLTTFSMLMSREGIRADTWVRRLVEANGEVKIVPSMKSRVGRKR